MTKTELMETYTAEQLADIVIELEGELKTIRNLENEVLFEERIVNNIRNATGMNIDDVRKAVQDTKKYMNDTYIEESKNQIEHMKSEVEKYRKAFEYAKKERDCQVAEYRKKIEELEEYTDSLKCSIDRKQDAINQIDSIICELFGIAHNGDIYSDDFKKLLKEKSAVGKTVVDFLPAEPIKVAEMLITAKGECEPLHIGNDVFKDAYRIFDVPELKQIAEYLLVYCNYNKEEEE